MESPQQRGFADEQADRRRSAVVPLPDAQHDDASRLSEATKEVSSMTEMVNRSSKAFLAPHIVPTGCCVVMPISPQFRAKWLSPTSHNDMNSVSEDVRFSLTLK